MLFLYMFAYWLTEKRLQFRLKLQPVNFYTNINLAYQDEPKYCKEVNRLIESRLMIITMDEETDIQIDDATIEVVPIWKWMLKE